MSRDVSLEDLLAKIPGVHLAIESPEFAEIERTFQRWWDGAQLANAERDVLTRTSMLGALAAFEKGWIDGRDQPSIQHAYFGFRNWTVTDHYRDAFGDEERDAARHAYAAGFWALRAILQPKERS